MATGRIRRARMAVGALVNTKTTERGCMCHEEGSDAAADLVSSAEKDTPDAGSHCKRCCRSCSARPS